MANSRQLSYRATVLVILVSFTTVWMQSFAQATPSAQNQSSAIGSVAGLLSFGVESSDEESEEERNVYLYDQQSLVGAGDHAIFTDGTDESDGMQFHATRDQLESFGVRTDDPPYPAELFPIKGTKTLDRSVDIGVDLAVAAALADLAKNPDSTQVFVGFSQGSIVSLLAAERLLELGVPASQIKVVTLGDTQTPNTGVQYMARRIGLLQPVPGAVLRDRPGLNGVEQTVINYKYDLMASAEDPFVNPGGFAQGVLGYIMIHMGAFGPDNYYKPVDSERVRIKKVDGITIVTIDTPTPFEQALEVAGIELPAPIIKAVLDASPVADPGSQERAVPIYPDLPEVPLPTVQEVAVASHQVVDSVPIAPEQQAAAHQFIDDTQAVVEDFVETQLPRLQEVAQQALDVVPGFVQDNGPGVLDDVMSAIAVVVDGADSPSVSAA